MRSDCTSLSSALFCHRFGRLIVFSMVFAISTRLQRKLVDPVDGHRLGDVALVTTVTSIISTIGSDSFSPESLLFDDDNVFVVAAVVDGDRSVVVFVMIAVAFTVSLTDELSSDDVFVSFSLLSIFWRYLPPTSLPFKYETAEFELNDCRPLLMLFTCNLFELLG